VVLRLDPVELFTFLVDRHVHAQHVKSGEDERAAQHAEAERGQQKGPVVQPQRLLFLKPRGTN